jgi:hypothetical protein
MYISLRRLLLENLKELPDEFSEVSSRSKNVCLVKFIFNVVIICKEHDWYMVHNTDVSVKI